EHWGPLVQTLEGDKFLRLSELAFSSDGKYLASSGAEMNVRLWDPMTGKLRSTLESGDIYSAHMAFSPAGKLAWITGSGTLRLVEPVTGVIRRSFKIREYPSAGDCTPKIAFATWTLAAICYSTKVLLWKPETDDPPTPILPDLNVGALAFSPQGKLALACRSAEDPRGHGVLLYDPNTNAAQSVYSGSIEVLAFSSNLQLALGLFNDDIIILDVATGTKKVLEGHSGSITTLDFSPDNSSIASGSLDNTLRLWSLSTGTSRVIESHTTYIGAVAFSHDGKMLASIFGTLGTTQLWDPSISMLLRPQHHSDNFPLIAFSPDGKQLASASWDQTVRIWNPATGELRHTLKGHDRRVLVVVFSSDGKLLASDSDDGTVRLWDPVLGKLRNTLADNARDIHQLIFSPDIHQLVISPDSKSLVSSSTDRTIRIWYPATGELRHRLECNGKLDGTRNICDLGTGQSLYTLEGDESYLSAIAFSFNNELLASTNYSSIRIWNLGTGQLRNPIKPDYQLPSAIAFSRDSKYVATGSSNDFGPCFGGSVSLWDATTGQQLQDCDIGVGKQGQLSFSEDGTYIETDRGCIQVDESLTKLQSQRSPPKPCWTIKESWLMLGTRRMLWLPRNIWDLAAYHENIFALVDRSGKIWFLEVDPDFVVP
ncbi:hypothetical protein MMC28_011744, partial [Mycoblastus sanguinarius]|nr:hypothetical protein [Mycoblastus sanguinarius]